MSDYFDEVEETRSEKLKEKRSDNLISQLGFAKEHNLTMFFINPPCFDPKDPVLPLEINSIPDEVSCSSMSTYMAIYDEIRSLTKKLNDVINPMYFKETMKLISDLESDLRLSPWTHKSIVTPLFIFAQLKQYVRENWTLPH